MVQRGMVLIDGCAAIDPLEDVPLDGFRFSVQGVDWCYQHKAYLMLNKPAAMECSRKPGAWPSIYTLLPAPLRQRPNKGAVDGVQAIGRLDQDTTGLLLLSDDGLFIHRMSSPRHHVAKVYDVRLKHPLDDAMRVRLLDGVILDDSPEPVRAAACAQMADGRLQLTLTEGKYHQVKRMVAAAGNRVEALHRSSIGNLSLPDDLAPGKWRWLSAAQVEGLRSPPI